MASRAKPKTPRKPARKAVPLEDRRERFVHEYLIDLNGTAAAIRAGYSPKGAHVTASRLLSDVNVAMAVRVGRNRAIQKLEISKDRVLQGLADLAFSSITDYGTIDADGFKLDMSKTTRGQASAIREITVRSSETTRGGKTGAKVTDRTTKLKLVDNRAPLVDLGRHLGIFKDDGAAAMTVSFSITGLGPAKVERTG